MKAFLLLEVVTFKQVGYLGLSRLTNSADSSKEELAEETEELSEEVSFDKMKAETIIHLMIILVV